MAVVLRRIFVAIMCIGITLSAVDALGLLCEYDCASEVEHSHRHQAAVQNAPHAEPDQHHQLLSSDFELAAGSSHSDTDCSSINALVVATGTTPDLPSPGRVEVDLSAAESPFTPTDGHFAVAVCGSPPLEINSSIQAASVSLRI